MIKKKINDKKCIWLKKLLQNKMKNIIKYGILLFFFNFTNFKKIKIKSMCVLLQFKYHTVHQLNLMFKNIICSLIV